MDEKILQWLGWEKDGDPAFFKFPKQGRTPAKFMLVEDIPKYSTSDAVAVALLPVVMDKCKNKYAKVMLESMSSSGQWFFTIGLMDDGAEDYRWLESGKQPTIAQAISTAVVRLIESI